MHLRFHDVHRTGAAVLAGVVAVEAVDRRQAGDQAVEDAFGHFVAVFIEDRVDGHQVAHVTHEQQRTAVQGHVAAIHAGVDAVRVHGAGEGLAALGHFFGQVALHQAEPVAVDHHFVIGVHGSHGVFAVHDGGQRGFHQHVFDAGSVGLADRGAGVDLDFEVQAIVLEQDCNRLGSRALETDQLGIVTQAAVAAAFEADDQLAVDDFVAGGIDVAAGAERCGFVEEGAGEGNHLVATHFVVALALLGAVGFADGVGAIERVVQRAPARIRGIQGEAGVHHRHDQLWAGHACDLVIDVLGRGLKVRGFWQQVADVLQEGFVGHRVMGLARVGLVPGIDPRLEVVAFGE